MTGETIRFKVDTKPLEEAIERAPGAVYFWLRSWLFRSLLDHRVSWLKSKRTAFGRGKDGIRVWGINQAPEGGRDPRWVVYQVHPAAKRATSSREATRLLSNLTAEAFAGSTVLQVHQEGATINVGSDWLAIPVRRPTKKNPRTPALWRAANPGKQLVTIRDPRRSDVLWLAEPKRYLGRRPEGRLARTKRKKVVRTKLIWRFLLVHQVKNKPTLRFYEAWDALASARQTDFARVADRILQDMARGKST